MDRTRFMRLIDSDFLGWTPLCHDSGSTSTASEGSAEMGNDSSVPCPSHRPTSGMLARARCRTAKACTALDTAEADRVY
ncbi:hypothetical protein PBRA_001814 [Plasmodiophora brassicae]|uniref:Uncharacterized protein n=1 Tax=Plasmodiophora brassicae TaxID=37360 RepID=A0A0G4IZN2_PLABS|nr:hypothetical protein PBRA_001814 [Plasmodiophora brassicae]